VPAFRTAEKSPSEGFMSVSTEPAWTLLTRDTARALIAGEKLGESTQEPTAFL
jgi:hypothetical protein